MRACPRGTQGRGYLGKFEAVWTQYFNCHFTRKGPCTKMHFWMCEILNSLETLQTLSVYAERAGYQDALLGNAKF